LPTRGGGKAAALLLSAILMIVEWFGRKNQYAIEKIPVKNTALRWSIYFIIIILIFNYLGEQSVFIYFQF
jgi:hypothetical protein